MSNVRSGITLIQGDGSFPPPKTRKIYPNKLLLWKYFLQVFIVWLIALIVLVISTTFFIIVSSGKNNPPFFSTPEFQLFSLVLFIVLTLFLVPPVLLSLFFYFKNMEYIVHGDEILVKKVFSIRPSNTVPFVLLRIFPLKWASLTEFLKSVASTFKHLGLVE